MSSDPLIDTSVAYAHAPETDTPLAGITDPGIQQEHIVKETRTAWQLSTYTGRLVEVSSDLMGACLTLSLRLVLEAQKQAEPVAWITSLRSTFFPPDAAQVGIDLSALPVIRAPDTLLAARAADHILRSGSFGLVVMDVGSNAHLPLHIQARLAGLARHNDATLFCITEKESKQPSLGSLVSMRVEIKRMPGKGDRFPCEAHFLKDKRRGPGWGEMEVYIGPDGLP